MSYFLSNVQTKNLEDLNSEKPDLMNIIRTQYSTIRLFPHFSKYTWNTGRDRQKTLNNHSLFLLKFFPGDMAIPNKELQFPASSEGKCGHLTTCWPIGYNQKQYPCTEGRAQVLSSLSSFHSLEHSWDGNAHKEIETRMFIAATAAAKSLQSCPTLCDPIDGSPPGSPVPGILQAKHWSGLPFPSPMHESEK